MTHPLPPHAPDRRFLWITPDRLLYVGVLGTTGSRSFGSVTVYRAEPGALSLRLAGGAWQHGTLAVVPPYAVHEVAIRCRHVQALKLEAETFDPAALPDPLRHGGLVDDDAFAARLQGVVLAIGQRAGGADLTAAELDTLLFGAPLAPRALDPRIRRVIDTIKRDPSVMASADDCARSVHLSFSRFLHLFRHDVDAPFRAFRTWKRARSMLHHVNRDANLAHVAQDTGYPDSTHFSHSIRQVFGLKPSGIFAGSRRLAIYGSVE